MGVGEFFLDPGLHRGDHFRRHRSRRLVIEVGHAATVFARLRIRRHSPRKRSTSAEVVDGPKLTRMTRTATSSGMPIAPRTRLGFMLPDEQALPAETETPARSI